MFIAVSRKCWSRWGTVIQHLAAEYNFPASTAEELNAYLQRYTGGGSTFRLERERWKFVIDVTRRGHDIVDIVAITLVAKTIEDHRHNGAVIARACDIHPNTDEDEYIGAPDLKWTVVTSGGMSFQHCCEKECAPPDRIFGAPRLTWETCRLKVIQKAYEQEVIDFRAKCKSLKKNASAAGLREKVLEQERALTRQDQAMVRKEQEIAELRERESNTKAILMGQERLHSRIAAINKENDVKEAIITNLRAELETLRLRKNVDGQNPNTTPVRQQEVAELHEKIGRLERKKAKSASKIEDQKIEIAELSNKIELLENQHDAAHEESLCEIQGLQETNTNLQKDIDALMDKHNQERETWQADIRLRDEDRNRSIMKKKEEDLVAKIDQLNADIQQKYERSLRVANEMHQLRESSKERIRRQTDHIDALRRENRNKTVYIDQLQQRVTHTQDDQLSMRPAPGTNGNSQVSLVDFDHQQAALRESRERADDLESKLDGMKQAMKDKKEEMSDLKKKYAEKIAAANAMEKRCIDKEAYTANLEKKLEELRGTMETVLEGVSVHQGRKRRRTEGPDFQL